jgi:hypothetical protein
MDKTGDHYIKGNKPDSDICHVFSLISGIRWLQLCDIHHMHMFSLM